MKPILLLPIGVAAVLGLFGLANGRQYIQSVELWLAQLDSPQTATASALAPIVDCANRVDRETRLNYVLLTHPEAAQPQASPPRDRWTHEEFGDTREPQARWIQKDVCAPTITAKLERQAPDSPLIGLAQQYVVNLKKVSAIGAVFSPALTTGENSPQQRLFGDVMQNRLKEELASRGAGYLSASAELREALAQEDQRLRPAQLTLLQARVGRDLHWHLLNYMIAARQAVNQIDQGVKAASLTPKDLAALTAAVQRAYENSAAFVDQLPNKQRDDETVHLWYSIRTPADAYLNALQGLLQDWLDHAPPQQLSDDYYLVTRRYDALLSYYNRPARNAF